MNYVFLDIDGVLNNLGSICAFGNPSKYLDPVSVALVARLCTEAPALIVVSSSWRTGNTPEVENALRMAGAEKITGFIVGETPYLGKRRGEEIQQWLLDQSKPDTRYVILDDDSDMLTDQPFVKTTFEDGFRFRHYLEALRYLNPEHEDVTRRILPVEGSNP